MSFPCVAMPLLIFSYLVNRREGPTILKKSLLFDGRPLFMYRLFLYTAGSDRQKSFSDTRSVCGFYIMPSSLEAKYRKHSASTGIINLTSENYHNMKDVPSHVVNEIFLAVNQRLNCIDLYGSQVRIFVDIVANVSDYPAAITCADVIFHTANRSWSIFIFGLPNCTPNRELVYSSDIHCRLLSITHFDERMNILRSEGQLDTDLEK